MKKKAAIALALCCCLILGLWARATLLAPTAQAANMPYSNSIVALLHDIQQFGWDGDSRLNKGLGGLWVNWRIDTNPLQTNFSGAGVPDPQGPIPRYDRLTDLRYLHALLDYKYFNPRDTQFDDEIDKFTAIIKVAFGGTTDDRGWVYDEMSAIADLSGDPWFNDWLKNLATYYDKKLFRTTIGMAYRTDSRHPNGFYRVSWAIEQGSALIQAGARFDNDRWQADGARIIDFTFEHAYVAPYHTLLYQMSNVLLPDGTPNPNETIDRTSTNNGGRIVMGENAQTIIALLDAFTASGDKQYADRADDLLDTFSAKIDRLGMWDDTYGGYFKQATFPGKDFRNPGKPVVDMSKKEVGRQAQMLQAYALANSIDPGAYYKMQHAMTETVIASVHTKGKWSGVQYEVRRNWSNITNPRSSTGVEDWMTSEAMGIVLIAIESLANHQPCQIAQFPGC